MFTEKDSTFHDYLILFSAGDIVVDEVTVFGNNSFFIWVDRHCLTYSNQLINNTLPEVLHCFFQNFFLQENSDVYICFFS